MARRVDAAEIFNRSKVFYEQGFGALEGNFWLGLEKMSLMVQNTDRAKLRVDIITVDGEKLYAQYNYFTILPKASGYLLTARTYNGNTGAGLDSFTSNKIMVACAQVVLFSDNHQLPSVLRVYWYCVCVCVCVFFFCFLGGMMIVTK